MKLVTCKRSHRKISVARPLGLLLMIFSLSLPGCGGSERIVPVSGSVTLDGQPLAEAEVVFAPMEKEGSMNSGPASIGKTDAQGRFSLNLLSGKAGAMVGIHRVGISLAGMTDEDVQAKVDAAVARNPGMSQEEFNRIETRIRAEAMAGARLPETYNLKTVITFEVAGGGTDEANFALKSDGSWNPSSRIITD